MTETTHTNAPSDGTRRAGRVKWYSLAKGYGFLEAADLTDDVFVHHTALRGVDDLRPGERVRFALIEAERGPAAHDVEVLDLDEA
ncbi:MAG: cold shock domain-containing protein [Acidobacteriota bacterium]